MKKIPWFLLAGVVLVGGWFWFKRHHDSERESDAAEKSVAKVETTLLRRESIARTLEAFGVAAASPSSEQAITAMFDCVVRRVQAAPGAAVAAGDVLLEIDPNPDTRLALESARSMAKSAAAALASAQERSTLKLATSQDLLAAQQADQEARLKLASFETRGLAGDGLVRSPVAGVVSKLEVVTGASVPAGTALATVTADGRLEARLGVEVSEAALVHSGQPVTLISASRSDLAPASSQVRLAGHALDAATGAAEVRVPVPPGAAILLGEHLRGVIELERKEALVAPRSAVLPAGDRFVLYTVKGGKAVRHEVKTGLASGDLVEVIGEGLQEGDVVVTLGNYELSDDLPVETAEPSPRTAKNDQAEEKPGKEKP